jgi:hypothetical protein
VATIDESVVKISPDFTGFKAKLRAGLKASTAGTTGKVRIEADCRGLARSVRDCAKTALANTSVKVKVEADCRPLTRSVRDCVRQASRQGITVKVDVDGRAAKRNSDATLRHMEQSSSGTARRISRNLSAAMTPPTTRMSDFALPTIIDMGAKGIRPTNLLLGAVAALSPALLAMGSSAVMASTSIAALGAASIGAVVGVTGLVSAFSNVFEAVKLAESARKSDLATAARGATQEINNGRQIQSAQRAVADARRRVGDAVEGVADAERALARAHRDAADAQAELNRERAAALRDLQDMREAASDLALDEEGASIALERALERQAEVLADCAATELDRREAALDVAQAQDRLGDVERERSRIATDLAEAERKGVNGSDRVVNARERIADANERVREAEDGVRDAQRGVADAHRDVAEAGRNLADVQAQQVASTSQLSSAHAQLNDQLAKMSPAGRRFVRYWIDVVTPAMEEFRRRMETAVLPGVLSFFRAVSRRPRRGKSTIDIMADSAERLGEISGDTARRLGVIASSPWFKASMVRINQQNATAWQNFADAALLLVRPFTQIIDRSAPLLTRFSAHVETLAGRFNRFINDAERSGQLADWFRRAGDEMAKWWRIAADLGSIVLSVFRASLPSGQSLVDRVAAFTAEIAKWAQSAEGERRIRAFFEFFRDLPYGNIAKIVGQVAALYTTVKLFTMLRGTNPVYLFFTWWATQDAASAAAVLAKFSDAMGELITWVDRHPGAVTNLLAVLAAYKGLAVLRGLRLPSLGGGAAAATGAAAAAGAAGTRGGRTGGAMALGHPALIVGSLIASDLYFNEGAGLKSVGKAVEDYLRDQLDPNHVPYGEREILRPIVGLLERALSHDLPEILNHEGKKGWTGFWHSIQEELGLRKPTATSGRRGGEGTFNRTTLGPVGAIKAEATAYRQLNDAVRAGLTVVRRNNVESANSNRFLQDYIRRRKESVTATVEHTKATRGETAAQDALQRETVRSALALSDTMVRLGWSRTAADKYAAAIYKIPPTRVTEARLPAIKQREDELKRINAQLDRFAGTREAKLSILPGSDAEKRIEKLVISQIALKNGWEPGRARQHYLKGFATGGPVNGPGTWTSDSITARLSRDEHVWTAQEVRAAGGHDAVERLRKSMVSGKYATGGPVMWPFPTNVSKTQVPSVPGAGPGGIVTGGGGAAGGNHVWMKQWIMSRIPGMWASADTGRRDGGYHGMGRALDMGFRDRSEFTGGGMARRAFNLIKSTFFRNIKELIWDFAGNKAVWNGREHFFTGSGAGPGTHNDHIHWAMANGGVISEPVIGVGRSGATYSFGERGPETVTPNGGAATVRIDRRDLVLLAQYITAASSRPIDMDGRRVAEAVNSYAYLPAGV